MAGDAGPGGTREMLLVLAVAGAGLALAVVAAFGPWHPASGGRQDRGAARTFHPGENSRHAT
ncbi:hypothetical protein [Micromonospora sp. NBS 11-29]|uniref:hypothetical protein n=1 Tax=Micromonospora sp. NBS 11-29 TaxID=1960879 RepID=UPI000B77E201|nr:hypothetical protein [Micromonospora sp. NBS 11-29]